MVENPYSAFDDYGLHHLARHLYDLRANGARRLALYRLICVPFMREKHHRTLSHRAFVTDLSLVIEAAAEESPPNLAQQVRGCLITAVLGQAASAVPPALLGVLAGVGQVERALELVTLIQVGKDRCRACLDIATALLERGKPAQAVEALERAIAATAGAWQDSLHEAYEGFEATAWYSGYDTDAFADVFAEDMEPDWTRDDALAEIAQELARAGALERASEVVDRIDYPSNKDEARAAIAQALVRQGDLDRAWEEMQAIDREWSRETVLVEAVRFLIQSDATGAAWEVAEQIEPGYWRDIALSEVAKALAERDGFEEALELAEMIDEERYQAYAWIGVAEVLLQVGEPHAARDIVEPLCRSSRDAWIASKLVPLLVALEDRDTAADVTATAIQSIQDRGWGWPDKAEALREIATALAHLSRAVGPGAAFEMIESLWDEREQICAMAWFAAALAKVNRRQRAKSVIQEAMTLVQRVREKDKRELILREVARATARVVGAERAIALVETIPDPDERNTALSVLAVALAEVGSPWIASQLAERLLSAAERVPQCWDRNSAIEAIAVSLAEVGEREKALAVVEAIGEERARQHALRDVSQADAIEPEVSAAPPTPQPGDVTSAHRAFAGLRRDIFDYNEYDMPASMARRRRRDAVVRVARDLGQAGDGETALKAVDVLDRAQFRAEALHAVAEGLALGGWPDHAVEIARGISYEDERVAALRYVARALDEIGNPSGALEVWQVALQEARWVGCEAIFQVLSSGAALIARMDRGRTLWRVFEAVREVEGWWEES
jgi:tetratricopeptide (TPR) repeat protein